MATIGLFFAMPQEDANAMRARLNELFGRLGYATEEGTVSSRKRRQPWRGGLPGGLIGLDKGEVVVVPVPDDPDQREEVIRRLRQLRDENEKDFFDPCSDPLTQALSAYADALAGTL